MKTIGDAAKASGISAKMIRHYEAIALIEPSQRSPSGYRLYSDNDIHTLDFIRQARSLGFSLQQIRRLLSLWQNRTRASADVKALAMKHIQELDQKIDELQQMRNLLQELTEQCHGDARAECPILRELESGRP